VSIILEALKRADASRESRSSGTAPIRVPNSRRPRRGIWLPISVVLIGLNLAVLAIWLMRSEPAQPMARATDSSSVSAAGSPPTGRAATAPPASVPELPTQVHGAQTASSQGSDGSSAPADTSEPSGAHVDPPLLGELPLSYRQTLPGFRLDVHVYADDPAQRFVMLDLERLGEGATSRAGLEIMEIQADGVVLRWDGQEFFYPR
jgi:general secretion pathway protein B